MFQSCRSERFRTLVDAAERRTCHIVMRISQTKAHRDCGSKVRSMSVMRRVVSNKWGEFSAGIDGVKLGGFSGFASKS